MRPSGYGYNFPLFLVLVHRDPFCRRGNASKGIFLEKFWTENKTNQQLQQSSATTRPVDCSRTRRWFVFVPANDL